MSDTTCAGRLGRGNYRHRARPRLLLCEGECNPDLALYDDRVREEVARGGRAYAALFATEALKGLRHTWHVPSPFRDWWICQVCGTEKRF